MSTAGGVEKRHSVDSNIFKRIPAVFTTLILSRTYGIPKVVNALVVISHRSISTE
jgi:hypothetical protein